MSRRRGSGDDIDVQYVMIEWMCSGCEARTGNPHRIGVVVRQNGRDLIGRMGEGLPDALRRIDGPNGETKVEARCATCREMNLSTRPQVRWDRLAAMLVEMQAAGEHTRQICPT